MCLENLFRFSASFPRSFSDDFPAVSLCFWSCTKTVNLFLNFPQLNVVTLDAAYCTSRNQTGELQAKLIPLKKVRYKVASICSMIYQATVQGFSCVLLVSLVSSSYPPHIFLVSSSYPPLSSSYRPWIVPAEKDPQDQRLCDSMISTPRF